MVYLARRGDEPERSVGYANDSRHHLRYQFYLGHLSLDHNLKLQFLGTRDETGIIFYIMREMPLIKLPRVIS